MAAVLRCGVRSGRQRSCRTPKIGGKGPRTSKAGDIAVEPKWWGLVVSGAFVRLQTKGAGFCGKTKEELLGRRRWSYAVPRCGVLPVLLWGVVFADSSMARGNSPVTKGKGYLSGTCGVAVMLLRCVVRSVPKGRGLGRAFPRYVVLPMPSKGRGVGLSSSGVSYSLPALQRHVVFVVTLLRVVVNDPDAPQVRGIDCQHS